MIFYNYILFLAKIQEECSDQLEKLIEDNRKLKNKVISLQTFAQRNKYKMKQMKRKGNLHIPYGQKIHTIEKAITVQNMQKCCF